MGTSHGPVQPKLWALATGTSHRLAGVPDPLAHLIHLSPQSPIQKHASKT